MQTWYTGNGNHTELEATLSCNQADFETTLSWKPCWKLSWKLYWARNNSALPVQHGQRFEFSVNHIWQNVVNSSFILLFTCEQHGEEQTSLFCTINEAIQWWCPIFMKLWTAGRRRKTSNHGKCCKGGQMCKGTQVMAHKAGLHSYSKEKSQQIWAERINLFIQTLLSSEQCLTSNSMNIVACSKASSLRDEEIPTRKQEPGTGHLVEVF